MSVWVSLSSSWSMLAFGCLCSYLSSKLVSFSHNCFKYSLCPFLFLGPSWYICWSTWWCATNLLGSVLFNLFSFCSWVSIMSIVLSSSSWLLLHAQIYLVNIFSVPVFILFSWRISLWFLFGFSVYWNFHFCSHIVFLTFSTSLFVDHL